MSYANTKVKHNFIYESHIACSQPTTQSGILIPHIQVSQRNDPITFKCKDGYRPTKEFSTLCLQNGTWTMEPNDVCSGWNEKLLTCCYDRMCVSFQCMP